MLKGVSQQDVSVSTEKSTDFTGAQSHRTRTSLFPVVWSYTRNKSRKFALLKGQLKNWIDSWPLPSEGKAWHCVVALAGLLSGQGRWKDGSAVAPPYLLRRSHAALWLTWAILTIASWPFGQVFFCFLAERRGSRSDGC